MHNVFTEIRTEVTFKKRRDANYIAHIHDDIELCYVIKGSGTAICNGKRYALKEKSVFIAFPYQIHQYVDFCEGEYIFLIIKPSRLLTLGDIFLQNDSTCAAVDFKNTDDDNLLNLLLTALKEYERDGYSVVIDAYLTTFFVKLLKHLKLQKKQMSSDVVLQILDYCLKNYKEPLAVDDVASALNISRSSVSHIFSSRLSISFNDYVNSLRLSDAVKLLKNTTDSVTEIASKVGFGTIRTFNRAFLKQYGMSPTSFRKK